MNRDSAQALQDALDGRLPIGRLTDDERLLVRLGRDCRRIWVTGPSPAMLLRIESRLDRFVIEDGPKGRVTGALAWFLGRGPTPHSLAHRIAAMSLFVSAIGFGGSAAAGVGPLELAKGIARRGGNIIVNLTPRDLSTADGPALDAGTVSESPMPGSTPFPPGQKGGDVEPVAIVADGRPPSSAGVPSATSPAAVGGQDISTLTPTATPNAAAVTTPAAAVTPPAGAAPTASIKPPASAAPGSVPGDETGPPGVAAPAATPSPTPVSTPTQPSTPTPTATVTPASTPTATPGVVQDAWQTATYPAGAGGLVVLRYSSASLELVEAIAAPGWTSHVEDIKPRYVKISFERDGAEVEFEAALVGTELVTTLDLSGQEFEGVGGEDE